MSKTFEFKGGKELEKALRELPKKIGRKVQLASLKRAAKPIINAARQNIHSVSGDLARGTKARVIPKSQAPHPTVAIGPHEDQFYGMFLEFGAQPHQIPNPTVGRGRLKRLNQAIVAINGNVFSRIDHPGITPKPWLRPAFDANTGASLTVLAKVLGNKIEKEAEKLGKR